DFTEFIDDYDNGGQKSISYTSTNISYSPAIVGGTTLNIIPFKNAELSFLSKYVSKQFLDNTENNSRVLNSFFVQDIRAIYTFKKKWLKEVNLITQVNNVFGELYEPNGYTYSYITGGETVTENYYFPMAGINFLMGINIKL
ncbi:MAG: TonB-dependent receptor, partial [Chitinophagaceae bacterium]